MEVEVRWNTAPEKVRALFDLLMCPFVNLNHVSAGSRIAWDCDSNLVVNLIQNLILSLNLIANKYREGKMQRTLKKGLKELEIVKRESFV